MPCAWFNLRMRAFFFRSHFECGWWFQLFFSPSPSFPFSGANNLTSPVLFPVYVPSKSICCVPIFSIRYINQVGNCYTGAVFVNLLSLICEAGQDALLGKRIGVFSYGSGSVNNVIMKLKTTIITTSSPPPSSCM